MDQHIRESSLEGSTPMKPLQDVIQSLVNALDTRDRLDRKLLRDLAERIQSVGLHQGFTSKEATQIVRIALKGTNRRLPPSTVSKRLLKAVKPARGHVFGEKFVLTILSSLGGTGEKNVDRSGLPLAVEETVNQSDDESSSSSEGGSSTDDAIRRRRVDVKSQGLALRLIVLLLSPPSTHASHHHSRPVGPRIPIPHSFLSIGARRTLDTCYGVLFHHLEYQTLRPYLCHILCTITQRKHVRHYRLTKVLSLRSTFLNEIHVGALLSTYMKFRPDLVFADNSSQRAYVDAASGNGIRYPDVRWLSDVVDIWQETPHTTLNGKSKSDDVAGQASTPSASHVVPPVTVVSTKQGSILITEVKSFRELGYKLDKVQLPSQLASALGHQFSLVALLAKQETIQMSAAVSRINDWMTSAICDEFALPLVETEELPFLSTRSVQATQRSTSLMKALWMWTERCEGCTTWLQHQLKRLLKQRIWDCLQWSEQHLTLRLVENFLPEEWDIFHDEVLEPLQILAKSANEKLVAAIVLCLANLLGKWGKQNWPALLSSRERRVSHRWGGVLLDPNVDYLFAVQSGAKFASNLACELLSQRPHAITLLHAAIRLHEVLYSDELVGLHTVNLPPQLVLYLPVFSPRGAIMTLSRLLGLVHTVRELHQDFLALKAVEQAGSNSIRFSGEMQEIEDVFYSEQSSDAINDCVILLVDLVWRNNGFASIEAGNADVGLPLSFFQRLSARCQNRGDEFERLGSASHSATLAVLMETYANDVFSKEPNAEQSVLHGPLTPYKLKQARSRGFPSIRYRDFRDNFLNWLTQQGAPGIHGLLNATITRFIRGQDFDQSTILA